ncbi:MAG: family 78 glycoside hydrolase catalytic domain [Armatimonadota bacterium]
MMSPIPSPTELHCEFRIDPLGIDARAPRLSWLRPSLQAGYHIQVASSREALIAGDADLWDSGQVQSDSSVGVQYAGSELASRDRCWWRVRTFAPDGTGSAWSEPAWWEMGLLEANDWRGDWIRAPKMDAMPLLRREFRVADGVRAARAYLCGLGFHEVYLNGRRIGDHLLDPAQTDYDQRAFYVVHNVTEALEEGVNAVGVILGDGWYNQDEVWGYPSGRVMSYGAPCLLMQIEIEDTAGNRQIIVSDEAWRCHPGPVRRSNVYLGEAYDARAEVSGWAEVGLDDATWLPVEIAEPPGGRLTPQQLPPIRRTEELAPVAIKQMLSDRWVVDFGQNFAGWVRIRVEDAPPGEEIRLRFAETTFGYDGMIDPASMGTFALHGDPADSYTCRGGGVEVWEPRFTYRGFRYAEVTGYPGDLAAHPEAVTGIVVHTDAPCAGALHSSDERTERIHEVARWTLRSNVHGIPTDCPSREKCGWLGDAHVIAEMASFNYDLSTFWPKYIDDIETSRRGELPPFVAPGKRMTKPNGAPDWGVAIVLIPWAQYRFYADLQCLRQHWSAMRQFVEEVAEKARKGLVEEGLGDWCPPGSVKPTETPVAFTSTALLCRALEIVAAAAPLVGADAGPAHFEALRQNSCNALIRDFWQGRGAGFGSQTANAMALAFGLVPDHRERIAADALAADVADRDYHHSTGIFGSQHLHWALCEWGHAEAAWRLLHNDTYPGIGHLMSLGATTFWECWGEAQIEQEEMPRSLNHPMQAAFDAWHFSGLAGINPDPARPGFRHTVLRPQGWGVWPDIEAEYRSAHGLIRSAWEGDAERIRWQITVPAGCDATVLPPRGWRLESPELETGEPISAARGPRLRLAGRQHELVYACAVPG